MSSHNKCVFQHTHLTYPTYPTTLKISFIIWTQHVYVYVCMYVDMYKDRQVIHRDYNEWSIVKYCQIGQCWRKGNEAKKNQFGAPLKRSQNENSFGGFNTARNFLMNNTSRAERCSSHLHNAKILFGSECNRFIFPHRVFSWHGLFLRTVDYILKYGGF